MNQEEKLRNALRLFDSIQAIAVLSQWALIHMEYMDSRHHLGFVARELDVIREKAEHLQYQLPGIAQATGFHFYGNEMTQRHGVLLRKLKKLLRRMCALRELSV